MRTALAIALAVGIAAPMPGQDPQLGRLAGGWKITSAAGQGITVRAPALDEVEFTFVGDQMVILNEPVVLIPKLKEYASPFAIYQHTITYQIKLVETKKGPAAIDVVTPENLVLKGIYDLKGDEMRICLVNWLSCKGDDAKARAKAAEKKDRPTEFTTKEGGEHVLFMLKRK